MTFPAAFAGGTGLRSRLNGNDLMASRLSEAMLLFFFFLSSVALNVYLDVAIQHGVTFKCP